MNRTMLSDSREPFGTVFIVILPDKQKTSNACIEMYG